MNSVVALVKRYGLTAEYADESPCTARWTSGDPCGTDVGGEHHWWRAGVHRILLRGCGAIQLPMTATLSARHHRWPESWTCQQATNHCCLEGEQVTHMCVCLATDASAVAA